MDMRTSDYSANDERSRGRGDSLGLLEYIFRSLPPFAPIAAKYASQQHLI
jgi:hypothetical protein